MEKTGKIRLGVCTSYENVQTLARLGYDYIELGFSALGALSEDEFAKVKETICASPLRAQAFNGMLPGTFRLTGEKADLVPVRAFLEKTFVRARELGGQVVVFGSGGARNVPEGFCREKAAEQLVEYLNMAGKIASSCDMRIVIEPLNRKESNILNSVEEGLSLCKKVNHPNVGVLADLYHIGQENETMDGILHAGQNLWHCHIAQPLVRTSPCAGDGAEDWYARFFAALHEIGYEGRVSIEGRIPDFEKDAEISYQYLKKMA